MRQKIEELVDAVNGFGTLFDALTGSSKDAPQ